MKESQGAKSGNQSKVDCSDEHLWQLSLIPERVFRVCLPPVQSVGSKHTPPHGLPCMEATVVKGLNPQAASHPQSLLNHAA